MEDFSWEVTRSDGVCGKTTLAAVWGQGVNLGDDDKSPGEDDKSLNGGWEHGSGCRGWVQSCAGSPVRVVIREVEGSVEPEKTGDKERDIQPISQQ